MRKNILHRVLPLIFLLLLATSAVAATALPYALPADEALTPRNYRADGTHSEHSASAAVSGVKLAEGDPTLLNHPEVINLVIFICFKDEDPYTVLPLSVTERVMNGLNGKSNSLADYYSSLSYGMFSVKSVSPTVNSAYFIYRDPSKTRADYEALRAEKGVDRYNPECTLLNNAVAAASSALSENSHGLTPSRLDVNGDGYVDSVSFIVSGSYLATSWGHLMWPHAWNLDTITKLSSSKTNSASVLGVRVENYTFTFASEESFKVGLIAHEFGHLIGLPDLYHYDKDTEYLPVGYWDLMHNECDIPQFTLAYTRQKYLGFLSKAQTPELTASGTYTLTPASMASAETVTAYKITLSKTESIWLEYRTNRTASYDGSLPSSGLIVYRINNKATGNTEGRHRSTANPDEIYVFRPSLATSGTVQAKERYNLDRAALSLYENNSSLGSSTVSAKYSPSCIYFTNGLNTGIKITVTEQTDEAIAFSVDLGEYDCTYISDSYVQGRNKKGASVKNEHHIYYGDEIELGVYVKYGSRPSEIEISDYTLVYENRVCPEGQTAYAVFSDSAGERRIPFTLYIYDAVKIEATVLSYPDSTVINAGEKLSLSGLSVAINYLSGSKEIVYYDKTDPSSWVIVEGFDANRQGTYNHVLVRYRDSVEFVLSGIRVVGTLVALKTEEKYSLRISGEYYEPLFNVIAVYADGTERKMSPSEYTAEFLAKTEFEKSVVRISGNENPSVTTETYGYLIGSATITSVSVKRLPDKTTVPFAAEPSFVGGTVTAVFDTGSGEKSLDLAMENYAASLLSGYKYNTSGKKTLIGFIGQCSFSLDINVLPKSSSVLTSLSPSITVNDTDLTITLKSPMSLKGFTEQLNSSLEISFADTEGKYEMPVSAFSSRAVGSNLTLTLKAASGADVLTYKVYLLGDSDGDGTISDDDIAGWIENLLNDNRYAFFLDADGDGFYTINDFVLLLRMIGGEA